MAVAQPAGGRPGERPRGGGVRSGYADPSLIIAAELAFDRLAVEKGQWTALARIVAKDALLFQPGPVLAEQWLKGQRNPSVPLRWQTQKVFMACDGSAAISTGMWVRAGGEVGSAHGRFTNIWRRDKGGYRLILSHDGPSVTAPQVARDEDELEAISARIAACPPRGGVGEAGGPPSGASRPPSLPAMAPLDPRQPLPASRDDRAGDGSLRWRWSVAPGGAPGLEGWMATEDGEAPILSEPAGPSGS